MMEKESENRNGDEPDHHDRPEQSADLRSAAALNEEQADKNDERQRNDKRAQQMAADTKPFDRTQHRDGRREHAVAIKECKPDNGGGADGGFVTSSQSGRAMRESRERQGAAFAIVVGAHDEADIFERHHDDERPEDERERAHDRHRSGECAAGCFNRLAQGVNGARADIAEHDAECAERQRRLMAQRFCFAMRRRRRWGQGAPGQRIV